MNQNTVQATELEYKMEASMRDLVRRSAKLIEELTVQAGTVAFQSARLMQSAETIKNMEWKIKKYEEAMTAQGMDIPIVGDKPDSWTETIEPPTSTEAD